jgi:hypothetical protein
MAQGHLFRMLERQSSSGVLRDDRGNWCVFTGVAAELPLKTNHHANFYQKLSGFCLKYF